MMATCVELHDLRGFYVVRYFWEGGGEGTGRVLSEMGRSDPHIEHIDATDEWYESPFFWVKAIFFIVLYSMGRHFVW